MLMSAVAAVASGAAHGKECRGVSFPEQIESGGAALKLNGLGLRQATFLKVDVYVAALYVPTVSRDAGVILDSKPPREIILHFVRDVGRGDLVKGWDEGFENNAKAQLPALKERIEAFKGMMADVKSGQRLRFVYKPGAGVEVEVSGAAKGVIAGDDFARALFTIWLGPRPPNDELKDGLLGGKCG
jgi:hypothetical protein